MALYSYRCRACLAATEAFRATANRDNPAYCLRCLLWSSRRILTAPALIGETVVRDQRSQADATV